MRNPEQVAMEIATKIVTAKASNSAVTSNAKSGEDFADFFEAIYTKVLKLATDTED